MGSANYRVFPVCVQNAQGLLHRSNSVKIAL